MNDKIYSINNKKANMNDVLLNVKNNSLNNLVALTAVKTDEDKKRLHSAGYGFMDIYTLDEFKLLLEDSDFPYDNIYYSPAIGFECCYYNKETLAIYPFSLFRFMSAKEDGNIQKALYEYLLAVSGIEDSVLAGKFEVCASMLPDRMAIEYIQMVLSKKIDSIKDPYNLFMSVYSFVDYGFSCIDKNVLDLVFSKKTKKQVGETLQKLKDYPDEIVIYRGENNESTEYGNAYSWTLNKTIANFFAARRGVDGSRIVSGKVKKEDIIEVLLDRNEYEVVVKPEDMYDVGTYELFGLSYFNKHFSKPVIINIYKKFAEKLQHIDFVINSDSDCHGRLHASRVLMLSLLIADALGLRQRDMETIATASIWHDTGRNNDGIDDAHGLAGMKKYEASTSNPDSIVKFICKYHCIDDEIAYAELEKNNISDKARCKLLFNIFKDADALDRVRFDLRDINIDYLRNNISKQFILIARIILENLK